MGACVSITCMLSTLWQLVTWCVILCSRPQASRVRSGFVLSFTRTQAGLVLCTAADLALTDAVWPAHTSCLVIYAAAGRQGESPSASWLAWQHTYLRQPASAPLGCWCVALRARLQVRQAPAAATGTSLLCCLSIHSKNQSRALGTACLPARQPRQRIHRQGVLI